MGRTRHELEVARRDRDLRRALGAQIRQLREDAGISQAALARAAGLDRAHVCRIESGTAAASLDAYQAIAVALGADLRLLIVPGAGVPIRDRYQAPMIEGLLRLLHRRWLRFLEVPVHRPVRGVVDLVLHDPGQPVTIASEAQSQIRRVEQQLRWHNLKADGLRAGSELPLGAPATVSRLLILRDTSANDRLVQALHETFATQYPADPGAALDALASAAGAWPGPALLWARIDGSEVAIRAHPRRRRLPD
ncbi:MAG: helix-turn-helix transcriptional regulator [Chloroflexi bacterium]|nr:helix-turn-helix transcriptional regulator [Chloroflexota bacterium]